MNRATPLPPGTPGFRFVISRSPVQARTSAPFINILKSTTCSLGRSLARQLRRTHCSQNCSQGLGPLDGPPEGLRYGVNVPLGGGDAGVARDLGDGEAIDSGITEARKARVAHGVRHQIGQPQRLADPAAALLEAAQRLGAPLPENM